MKKFTLNSVPDRQKDQQAIFDALKFKHRPYVRKTKVLTQM